MCRWYWNSYSGMLRIENVLKSIPGSHNIENLDLDVRIEGTLSKPEVKPDLSKALKTFEVRSEANLQSADILPSQFMAMGRLCRMKENDLYAE